MTIPPAPSAAPNSVSVSEVTSSSITVQWGAVPCIHRNGEITGYSVQYGVVDSESTQTISVSGDFSGVISNLESSTDYSIKVAAMNSVSIGPYSDAVIAQTDGMYSYTTCILHIWYTCMTMVVKLLSPLSCSNSRTLVGIIYTQHEHPYKINFSSLNILLV